jgi:hypothetical protein
MPKDPKYSNITEQDLISLDGILETLKNKKKLFWLNFKAGFVRGFAGILGAALAVILIGVLATYLGGIPMIGDFIKQISDAVKSTN